ncbi:dipeptidase 1-like isoform X1 [Diorhabda carinulata]|uniref:dipeptidase 1-like isoform X1 n=1 Tax=Diorhabda carinulata TaxID=1163345 RepID=UPI0025A167EA|nr:dipeptidase 1-like isoform X1 [Diorhabda carinulata]
MVTVAGGGRPHSWLSTLDPELRQHIQNCPCPCNHMGYGNVLDYQIPHCAHEYPIRETSFNVPQYYNDVRDYYHPYDYHGSIESCSCSTSSDTSKTTFKGPWCICIIICVLIATLTAGLGLPLALGPHMPPQTSEQRLDVIKKLLKEQPLIDGHNDLPWNLRKFVHNKLFNLNLSSISDREPWATSKWSHTDIPKLRAGLLGAQFWSAYVPCKAQHLDAVQVTLEQIDVIKRLVEFNSNHFSLVRSTREIRSVHKEGRIASLIGVEGGHALGNSLAVLRTFYSLGARYLTITHSCDTPWATGTNTKTRDGLSEFGKSVIKEMNRLGMIIDLSHTSMTTAKAALNISRAPVIFSHSSAFSLCNSSRNVPDDVLKLIAHNGGVVMVNFYTYHVTCNETATIQDVIKHINHIRTVAGIEHVGIGAGYDGINMTPSGLEDVSKYPYLLAELLADPNWTEKDVVSLAGLNLLRVFEGVQEVRDKWKNEQVLPVEDEIPPMHNPCSSLYS